MKNIYIPKRIVSFNNNSHRAICRFTKNRQTVSCKLPLFISPLSNNIVCCSVPLLPTPAIYGYQSHIFIYKHLFTELLRYFRQGKTIDAFIGGKIITSFKYNRHLYQTIFLVIHTKIKIRSRTEHTAALSGCSQ